MEPHSVLTVPKPPVSTATCFPWFAIRTRAKHEKVAATILANKGFEQYLPVYRSGGAGRSDRRIRSAALSGYFFCRFDPKKRLPILTTPNVVSIVGFSNEPAPVPDSEIEAVQAILRSGLATSLARFCAKGKRSRPARRARGPRRHTGQKEVGVAHGRFGHYAASFALGRNRPGMDYHALTRAKKQRFFTKRKRIGPRMDTNTHG